MRNIGRDKVVLGVLVVMTIGAMLARSYAQAGFIVSLAGLVLLFLSGVRRTVSGVRHYRMQPPLTRAWIALQGIELIIIINSIVIHRVAYFPVLLVLGAEFFIWDKQERH